LSAATEPARGEALKLTFYFGEHDRHRGRFLSEAILDLFERRELATSVLLRGAEGFGARRRLQTDRLLSLSEDLPLVAVAVDRRERVEAAAAELAEIAGDGLLTLERARFGEADRRPEDEPQEEVKLTVYTGRRERLGSLPAHVGVVQALRSHGVGGATVLLGVDGTARGQRLRARFFAANAGVPAMTVAVGERGAITAALTELECSLGDPLVTLEAVRVCRRDGRALARPLPPPKSEGSGLDVWTKLIVYCSERSESGGHALHLELVRRLRAEGAAGATALRGVWGYHGDHAPHGDRLLALRRHVPILTVLVDTPARCERWFEVAAELTEETGLVTSEVVPAIRISGPGGHLEGGLRLANLQPRHQKQEL
jgi:PII-like signaling protein